MIDLGDELDGYGEESNESQIKSKFDDRYLPKGGHVRLSDLKKTGFNVRPGTSPTGLADPDSYDPYTGPGWKSIPDSSGPSWQSVFDSNYFRAE